MLISKIVKDEKKFLNILGINMQYEIITNENKKIFKMGIIRVTYFRDDETDAIYIVVLGHRVYLKESRKSKHYRNRHKLDLEYCKKILIKEISPLVGYNLNLDNPQTFNEKINWLKMYNQDHRITTCCDKFAVKEYAKKIIGEKYILPIIGQWTDAKEINFDELPNKFVLKVNWSSGFNIIVKNKDELNIKETIVKLNNWMKPSANSYYDTFNWGYKNMKPIIYAEPYIEQIDGQVYDYKLYYSKGVFIYMFIATDRHSDTSLTYTFFDNNLDVIPLKYGKKPNANPIPKMPKNINEMMRLGRELAQDFPFVRIDFYEVDDEVYLGEMTFYSGGGTLCFQPIEWDLKMGEKINLN